MQLSQEEQDNLKLNYKDNFEKNENNNVIYFSDPIPKTNFCYLCQRRFDDYLVHIETMLHKNNINQNPILVNRVHDTFKRINQFWNKKKIIQNNIDKKNDSDSKTLVSSAFSLSPLPSINSALKSDINNSIKNNSTVSQDNYIEENLINEKYKHIKYKKNKSQLEINDEFENKEFRNNNSLIEVCNKPPINLLMRKRKLNILPKNFINCVNNENFENNIRENDYFSDLNIQKTKRLIRNVNIFFK